MKRAIYLLAACAFAGCVIQGESESTEQNEYSFARSWGNTPDAGATPEECGVLNAMCCEGRSFSHTCLKDCCEGVCVDHHCIDSREYLLNFDLPVELDSQDPTKDLDTDGLDDSMETYLAMQVAPPIFYDEDEDCSAKNNELHYGRRDFFQVRPFGEGKDLGEIVPAWTPSTKNRIKISYYFLYPHDCKPYVLGWELGHLGDTEQVEFILFSYDKKTWYLEDSRYWHHENPSYHYFSGVHHRRTADELKINRPIVAADEDGHGSWPGRYAKSSHCAGKEDDEYSWNIFGFLDCFVGTMGQAYMNHDWEPIDVSRNIGEPEHWNTDVVQVEGDEVFMDMNVGHGLLREYWKTSNPKLERFCGWECQERQEDGNCKFEVHGKSKCVQSTLWSKVDKPSKEPWRDLVAF